MLLHHGYLISVVRRAFESHTSWEDNGSEVVRLEGRSGGTLPKPTSEDAQMMCTREMIMGKGGNDTKKGIEVRKVKKKKSEKAPTIEGGGHKMLCVHGAAVCALFKSSH